MLGLTLFQSALTVWRMNVRDLSAPSAWSDEDAADPWVLAAKAEPMTLHDCSLVLSAMGIAHQTDRRTGAILVRKSRSRQAMAELLAFREENRDWPPPVDYQQPLVSRRPTLLLLGGLVMLHAASGPWQDGNPWFEAGAVNSRAIMEHGQWWRLFTALTLHADQSHLVGNCVIGGMMAHLLCKILGSGTAWLALLLSAALANLLNSALRTEAHHSVGFSTAVFAAIGIFCGRQLVGGSVVRHVLLPLGAGLGLLAMLGTGNEGGRTDLGAHLFGLACGLACGFLLHLAKLDQQGSSALMQQLLFAAALSLLAISWLQVF